MGKASKALLIRPTDWWKDGRRHWCAYCGIAIRSNPVGENVAKATYDHVVSRVHKGRHVTLPACLECNRAKSNTPLPDFLISEYFANFAAFNT